MENSSRRIFLKQSAITAMGLSAGLQAAGMPGRTVMGANEKIRMGFIGIGNRGSQLLNMFMQNTKQRL